MPEHVFNLYEAKTSLSRLVDRAAAGEEIVIAKNGVPLARLVGLAGKKQRRRPGGWEGRVVVSDDFDEPLPAKIQTAFEAGPGESQ